MSSGRQSPVDRLAGWIIPAVLLAAAGDVVVAATASDAGSGGVHLGPLIRGAIYLLAFATLVFRRVWNWQALAAVTIVLLAALVAALRSMMWLGDGLLISAEIQWLFRLTYAPILVLALLDALGRRAIRPTSLMAAVAWLAVILSLLVVVPAALGLGRQTYSWGVGSSGLLIGQNEAGLALAIAIPPLLWAAISRARWMLVPYTLACVASLTLGTRFGLVAPALLSCATIAMLIWGQIRNRRADGRGSMLLSWWLGGTAQLVVIIAGIGVVVYVASASPHQFRKLQRMLNGDVNRAAIADPALEELASQPELLWSVGPGRARVQRGLADRMGLEDVKLRAIEVDWIDLAAGIGAPAAMLVGAAVLLALSVWTTVWLVTGSVVLGVGLLSSLAFVSHAVLAGHAIGSVVPSTMLAMVLACTAAGQRNVMGCTHE
jgi:hypothetical protein